MICNTVTAGLGIFTKLFISNNQLYVSEEESLVPWEKKLFFFLNPLRFQTYSASDQEALLITLIILLLIIPLSQSNSFKFLIINHFNYLIINYSTQSEQQFQIS